MKVLSLVAIAFLAYITFFAFVAISDPEQRANLESCTKKICGPIREIVKLIE